MGHCGSGESAQPLGFALPSSVLAGRRCVAGRLSGFGRFEQPSCAALLVLFVGGALEHYVKRVRTVLFVHLPAWRCRPAATYPRRLRVGLRRTFPLGPVGPLPLFHSLCRLSGSLRVFVIFIHSPCSSQGSVLMVTTRVNREFADQVERLANTKREFFSAVVTDFSMILAMQTDRNRLDKLGDYVLRRPVRLAALMSERPDPILLSAMAGDRALRNLAGLDSTGTDGEKLDYVTTLEAVAATAARDYVRLCQTDPVEARAQAARWSANRSGVRSSFLREGVEAAESTYGVATDAITDRASGRRPLLALLRVGSQPVSWLPSIRRSPTARTTAW